MNRVRSVLMASPIDISSDQLGPISNESEFAKILAAHYRTYLIVGISPIYSRYRSSFVTRFSGRASGNLRVVTLPILYRKYLALLSKLVFAFLSSFILLILCIRTEVKAIIARDNSVPTVMSFFAKLLRVPLIYRPVSTPFRLDEIGVFNFPWYVSRLFRIIMRIFDVVSLRRATRIFVSSPTGKDMILSQLPIPDDKIVFVPYPIPDIFFSRERPTVRQEESCLDTSAL